jgi:hypothetical protein
VISGSPYRSLIEDVERRLGKQLDRPLPPKKGGVSIEGLSAMPEGGLLIAFRSPLIKDKALLIALNNPDAVVDSGAPAEFGNPILLDLSGRGIRSIEYWHARSSYLIIAGPSGDGSGASVLMRWSGPVSKCPETLSGVSFDDPGLENCAPEGLLVESQSNTVYVLFDEGNRKTQDPSFRSIAIRDLLP